MMTLMLITYHIALVSAVFWTAYRTGYRACADDSRRKAEAQVGPLREILERLNLDAETLLNDKRDDHHD
jgi:hypothetical protein